MRQGYLDHLPGMVRLQLCGSTGHGPVPRRPGDESEQETGSPNDRGMIDDFRLRGSRTWRGMGVTLSEGGVTSKGDMMVKPTTLFSQRAEPLPVVVGDFHETAHQTRDNTDFPRPLREGEARLRLACPPSPGAPTRRARRGTRSAAQRSVPGSQPTQCNTLGLARGSGPFEPPTGENSPLPPHHPRRSLLPLPGTWSLALTLACPGRGRLAGLGAGN